MPKQVKQQIGNKLRETALAKRLSETLGSDALGPSWAKAWKAASAASHKPLKQAADILNSDEMFCKVGIAVAHIVLERAATYVWRHPDADSLMREAGLVDAALFFLSSPRDEMLAASVLRLLYRSCAGGETKTELAIASDDNVQACTKNLDLILDVFNRHIQSILVAFCSVTLLGYLVHDVEACCRMIELGVLKLLERVIDIYRHRSSSKHPVFEVALSVKKDVFEKCRQCGAVAEVGDKLERERTSSDISIVKMRAFAEEQRLELAGKPLVKFLSEWRRQSPFTPHESAFPAVMFGVSSNDNDYFHEVSDALSDMCQDMRQPNFIDGIPDGKIVSHPSDKYLERWTHWQNLRWASLLVHANSEGESLPVLDCQEIVNLTTAHLSQVTKRRLANTDLQQSMFDSLIDSHRKSFQQILSAMDFFSDVLESNPAYAQKRHDMVCLLQVFDFSMMAGKQPEIQTGVRWERIGDAQADAIKLLTTYAKHSELSHCLLNDELSKHMHAVCRRAGRINEWNASVGLAAKRLATVLVGVEDIVSCPTQASRRSVAWQQEALKQEQLKSVHVGLERALAAVAASASPHKDHVDQLEQTLSAAEHRGLEDHDLVALARAELARANAVAADRADPLRRAKCVGSEKPQSVKSVRPVPNVVVLPSESIPQAFGEATIMAVSKAAKQRLRRQRLSQQKAELADAAERQKLLRAVPRLREAPDIAEPAAELSLITTVEGDTVKAQVLKPSTLSRETSRSACIHQRPMHRQMKKLTVSLAVYHQVIDAPEETPHISDTIQTARTLQSSPASDGEPPVATGVVESPCCAELDKPLIATNVQTQGLCTIDPMQLHFSHDSVSSAFRSGLRLDDAIHSILDGTMEQDAFPPVEAVVYNGKFVVVKGNRRLFVFRILAALGTLDTVNAVIVPWSSETIQRQRWDPRLGRLASKWERAVTSQNGGRWVHVRSMFKAFQLGFDNRIYGVGASSFRGRPASVFPLRNSSTLIPHKRRATSSDK